MQEYKRDQQKEILKAHKALNDFLDAVQKVDNHHQEQLFMVCFGEIARRNQWQKLTVIIRNFAQRESSNSYTKTVKISFFVGHRQKRTPHKGCSFLQGGIRRNGLPRAFGPRNDGVLSDTCFFFILLIKCLQEPVAGQGDALCLLGAEQVIEKQQLFVKVL